ncbi:MAG TPA: hypothetical protein VKV30_11820 [Candidatus Angelobacter sp.]|nr:hypothetical protein [Candidatus Angelobacter sp.]
MNHYTIEQAVAPRSVHGENCSGFSLLPECLALRLAVVACPFFFPTERISIDWPFPARLPLGAGFAGTCRAGEVETTPSETELRDFCNMGYAGGCPHLPADRCADNVRFAVARDEESRIILHYVSERCHQPVEYGRLEYDCQSQRWLAPMRDACLQRQAECFVEVYLERRPRTAKQ